MPTGCLEIINKINPDIVQLHWVGINTISIKEIGLIKQPIVWRLSDMWPMCASEHYNSIYKDITDFDHLNFFNIDRYILYLKKKYWNKNIHFVAPSSWIKSKLKKSILTKRNEAIIISNAIDNLFWKKINNSLKFNKIIMIIFSRRGKRNHILESQPAFAIGIIFFR